jgi:hypothetical protein
LSFLPQLLLLRRRHNTSSAGGILATKSLGFVLILGTYSF